MQLKRIVGCIAVKDGRAVQSLGFHRWLPLGRPQIAARYLDRWGIDEIVVLDIDATARGNGPDRDMVSRVAAGCRVPLTVGGGIRSVDDMRAVLRHGADKVAVNSAALLTPQMVAEGAAEFGRQCIVASIDTDSDGTVFSRHPDAPKGLDAAAHAAACAERGAGEILLNSVPRDGARGGYDLRLIGRVCGAISVPLIAVGGAGHPDHVRAVLADTPAAAAGVGNMLNHGEHSVAVLKAWLRRAGVPVRIDTAFTYAEFDHDEAGRIARLPDAVLAERFYQEIEQDVI
ncbi:MAG: imidazole glycerol phosphate synthase cyclase subunit [Acetobacterales bacterium]